MGLFSCEGREMIWYLVAVCRKDYSQRKKKLNQIKIKKQAVVCCCLSCRTLQHICKSWHVLSVYLFIFALTHTGNIQVFCVVIFCTLSNARFWSMMKYNVFFMPDIHSKQRQKKHGVLAVEGTQDTEGPWSSSTAHSKTIWHKIITTKIFKR